MDSQKFKILHIGHFLKNATETHIAKELEKTCEVYRYSKHESSKDALSFAKEVDLVLFHKLPSHWSKFIEEVETKTVCWLFDVYPFMQRDINEVQFKADVVFSTGGIDNTEIIRQGVPTDQKELQKRPMQYDVVFVGSLYSEERVLLHQFLSKTYKDKYLQIGDVNEIRGIDLNRVLWQTKIVVGDSFPKDNYWSNRVYEITGRGGFIIHPEVKGMKKEFPNLVYFKYGDMQDLKEKIDYYLKNDKEREEIRELNFLKCPTYEDRVKELLCKI